MGHAILHAATLIQLKWSAYHKYFVLQFASGHEPDVSRMCLWQSYVLISPPQKTKMVPQKRLRICGGYTSPSIIK